MSFNIGPQLVSKLGSPDSRIPLGVKDSFNSAGYTYFSYDAGGSVEGKDRFVDEVGTGIIWLWGIPAYKKLIDKTLYKISGISPQVDVRTIKDKNFLKEAIKQAPSTKIKKELQKAGEYAGRTKGLAAAKFIIAMGLTMLSYLGLTKAKQKMTKLNIEKEFNEKMKLDIQNQENETANSNVKSKQTDIFTKIENQNNIKNNGIPSFGSGVIMKHVEEYMLNPVKNMMLLDVGISGERLANARTDGELKEYAIKEGSFLFFVYKADQYVKGGIESLSKTFLKLPVSLDAKFLSSDLAKKILTDETLQNEIKDFSEKYIKNNDKEGLHKYILKKQNNIVVKAAKQSGIIDTVKGRVIDTRKYIDEDKIKQLVENLEDYINFSKNSKDIDKYISKIRGLKIASTMISVGISCLTLGYIVPKFMYEYRHKQQDGNSAFHVKTEYEKELAQKAGKNNENKK